MPRDLCFPGADAASSIMKYFNIIEYSGFGFYPCFKDIPPNFLFPQAVKERLFYRIVLAFSTPIHGAL